MIFHFLFIGLSTWCIWQIIAESRIFEPLRAIIQEKSEGIWKFIKCPQCFGFWIGLFCELMFVSFTQKIFFSKAIDILLGGFYGSGISVIISAILRKLD